MKSLETYAEYERRRRIDLAKRVLTIGIGVLLLQALFVRFLVYEAGYGWLSVWRAVVLCIVLNVVDTLFDSLRKMIREAFFP